MMQPGPTPSGLPADLAFGRCLLRPAARQLLVDGQPVPVGARAFDLLLALVERRERVVGKDELLDLVWPGVVVEENNLQVHVAALRKHLGASAIATVSGRGYRFAAELLPSAAAPPAAAPLASVAPGAPLFGRDLDLQTLHYLLQAHRLVSIVGAGGIGKTALARAVAAQQAARFVDLAPLERDDDVAPALDGAAAAGRSGLLVLDNCEHRVRAVADWVARALAARPDLHLLATSQEPLRLPGEQVYRVSALALPAGPGLAAAQAASAVRLFEARARAADGAFVLDEANVALVVSLCRQLDGVALAIELAAARLPLLGLQGLHDRLDQRLRLLATHARDVPPRQRSLAAALAWSHALLSPDEQAVLRRLAVMAGPFSPDSAQAVAAGDGLDGGAVLDALGALVDRSLVVAAAPAAGGEPTLRLLETVRQFALERLAEAGEEAACRLRHGACMLALAERAGAALAGPAPGVALARLDAERDNLLAALAAADGDQRQRLAAAVQCWCLHRDGLPPWVLAEADAEPAPQGRSPGARPQLVSALRQARARGDRLAMLEPLLGLCLAARAAAPEERPLVAQWLQEAQAIADELDSPPARRRVAALRDALPPV